jgi:cysteine desulfurase
MNEPVYLDYNATTPIDERVLEHMLPFLKNNFGNAASSTHQHGWIAKQAVDDARRQVASLIGAEESEIIFTSGSTEAINLALKGVCEIYKNKGNHIVTVKTEHKAVLDTCEYLAKKGAEITYLDVDAEGLIDLQQLESCITDKTVLVAVMYANNETGVIQPVEEIAQIIHAKNSIFFCDATQAVGKTDVDVMESGIDLLCLSAHKFYGPKGAGALYVRRKNPRVTLSPLIHGGGHEKGLRSGTLNVPGIVALGKACELAKKETWDNNTSISKLRAYLEHQLLDIPGMRINGSTRSRLYNTSNICFSGYPSSKLIAEWSSYFSVASGSACTSAISEPSHVLQAMGLNEADSYASVRFSFGKYNTQEEVEKVVKIIKNALL